MSTQISRRQFVRVATFGGIGLAGAMAGARFSFGQSTQSSSEKPLYAFPLLGDIHYDRMEHHDMQWVQAKMAGDLSQIHGYVKATEQYTPRLFAEVSDAVRAQAAPVPFVIQVGDLVEGLCGSFDLQSQQFRDATAAVEKANMGVPFLVAKGNHDITGPGAPEAFDKVLLPWIGKQAGQDLKRADYVHRHGDDVFVFFDAYKPDLDWLEAALKGNKARQTFFVIHPPVVPYNARSNWHIYPDDARRAERDRLLSLLGSRRAVVLTGHLHKYSILRRRTPTGPIDQLAVCSVVRNDHEKPRQEVEGVAGYTPDLVQQEPKHQPNNVELRRQLLKAEAPFIERFEYADLPGYAIVKVYADRVETDVYAGVGKDLWRQREVTPAT
jgi:hypothetical protein